MGFLEGGDNLSYQNAITWSAMTHIDDFATAPNSDGTITCDFGRHSCNSSAFTSPRSTLISTAHSHGAKVLMCITDGGAATFINATSSGTLNSFISNIMSIVNTNHYDGVDIDWEANIESSSAHAQMTTFLTALRSALGSSRLLVADAIPNDWTYWSNNYSNLDRVNFMAYDWEGNWNPYSWFNSALYSDSSDSVWSIDMIKRRAIASGIPAGKIMISMPFYGYVSTGGATGPRQSSTGNLAQTTYAQLIDQYSSQMANPTVDSVAEVPWFSISNGWVEYDNPASLTTKLKYIKSNGLGGAGYFSLQKDAPGQPLAAAVAAALGTSSNPETAPSITSTSPLSAGTLGASYTLSMASTGTQPLVWSLASGSLPSGLSFNTSNGAITGTPTTAGTTNFTVQASNAMGTSSRQFSLTVNAQSKSASWYNLKSENSGMCLDVLGMSTSAGATLDQWPCSGVSNENFQFTPVTGGYKITAQNSGLQLDVQGGSNANGTPIIQYPYWGGKNQTWTLVPNSDGSYSITASSSGNCMSVAGGSTAEAAPIQEWQCTAGSNQKWKMVPVQ